MARSAVAAVAAAVLLVGCGPDEPSQGELKLAGLKADPMATLELPNLQVIDVSESVGFNEEDDWMGKQSLTRYTREVVIESGSIKAALADLKAAAEAHGWQTDTVRRDALRAYKTLEIPGANLVGPAEMTALFDTPMRPVKRGVIYLSIE